MREKLSLQKFRAGGLYVELSMIFRGRMATFSPNIDWITKPCTLLGITFEVIHRYEMPSLNRVWALKKVYTCVRLWFSPSNTLNGPRLQQLRFRDVLLT